MTPNTSHLDPRIAHFETEVRQILDLQNIAQSMPNAFTDLVKVTSTHIPTSNMPTKISVSDVC